VAILAKFVKSNFAIGSTPDAKIIDVFICKLRKKLANASGGLDYIETVWGRGYALREIAEQSAAS
jgi:two-component system cell cycle response regulator CtrA